MKKIYYIAFLFQIVTLITYIFLLDTLMYISVFSLWFSGVLFGIGLRGQLNQNK